MYQIQQITSDSNQTQTLILPDGTQIILSMYYVPRQYGWFISNLTYNSTSFNLNSLRITNNPNMLRQWKNELPFGLACFSASTNREPSQIADFSTGLFGLYILSADEVIAYEAFLSGGSL